MSKITPSFAKDLLKYRYKPQLRKLEAELKEAQNEVIELQKKIEQKKAEIVFLEKRSSEQNSVILRPVK
jgi:predicted  nucleic acid-binding Zn-ribbon protein